MQAHASKLITKLQLFIQARRRVRVMFVTAAQEVNGELDRTSQELLTNLPGCARATAFLFF